MIGKPSQSSFNSGLKSQKFQHLISSSVFSSFHSSILHAKLPNPFNKAACQQSLDFQKGASRARAVACCSGSLVWCRNTACTCSHYPWTSPPGWSVQAGCPPKHHANMNLPICSCNGGKSMSLSLILRLSSLHCLHRSTDWLIDDIWYILNYIYL